MQKTAWEGLVDTLHVGFDDAITESMKASYKFSKGALTYMKAMISLGGTFERNIERWKQ